MCNGTYYAGSSSSTGGWYSHNAANVGTSTSSVSSGSLTYNICAKNWTMPTTAVFQKICNSYASSWVRTGYTTGWRTNNSLNGTGSYDIWWSRSVYSSSVGASLTASSKGSLFMDSDDGRNLGETVRCLAK